MITAPQAAKALIYLQLTSLYGLVRSRLLRLKQPKYLAGAVVGGAYIYFFFLRRAATGQPSPAFTQVLPTPSAISLTATAIASLVLLVLIVLNWVLPRATASLAFSEAEIAFLFPAPISRRALVHYRLLGTQLGLLFGSTLLALFSRRWTYLGGGAGIHVLGWWLILATLSLHSTGSSFAITRLRNRGVPAWAMHLVALALVLAVAGFAIWRLAPPAPTPEDLLTYQSVTAYLSPLASKLTTAPLAWILALPSLVLRPFLSPDWHSFLLALPGALLVLGAHYAWALLSAVSFEEASIARAEKRAARLKARREGTSRAGPIAKARRARFRLAPAGRPETAFLWKNLLATPTFISPRTALIVALVVAAGCAWLATQPMYRALLPVGTGIALVTAAYTLILGPQLVRYDLRADLLNADMLKTYPLRGWQIVLGELLTPIAILAAVMWLALLAAMLLIPSRDAAWLSIPARAGITASLALLVPPICALQLLTPNAMTVLLPAWALAVANRSEHGLDVLGQRLIFVGGQLVITLLALVPPALCAALAFFIVDHFLGRAAAVLSTSVAALPMLVAELWLGIWLLGYCFERFDLSRELRA